MDAWALGSTDGPRPKRELHISTMMSKMFEPRVARKWVAVARLPSKRYVKQVYMKRLTFER
jgi:hypothetical protein